MTIDLSKLVRGMVWDQRDGMHAGWFADADTGVYRVVSPNSTGLFMWMRYSAWPLGGVILGMAGDLKRDAFPTLAAAQSAAQADHASRVLAALDVGLLEWMAELAAERVKNAGEIFGCTAEEMETICVKERAILTKLGAKP